MLMIQHQIRFEPIVHLYVHCTVRTCLLSPFLWHWAFIEAYRQLSVRALVNKSYFIRILLRLTVCWACTRLYCTHKYIFMKSCPFDQLAIYQCNCALFGSTNCRYLMKVLLKEIWKVWAECGRQICFNPNDCARLYWTHTCFLTKPCPEEISISVLFYNDSSSSVIISHHLGITNVRYHPNLGMFIAFAFANWCTYFLRSQASFCLKH